MWASYIVIYIQGLSNQKSTKSLTLKNNNVKGILLILSK